MNAPETDSIHALLGGQRRGPGAAALRSALRCAEPLYAGAMRLRNWLYDSQIFAAHRAAVPVVSVGNITAGGTGKTPLVCWLAARLRRDGLVPAVLLRGYKSGGGFSDEEDLLRETLAGPPAVVVHAGGDRVAGAAAVLREHPDVDIFILDDGFQHRRLVRDFDLVLIDATNPFGYGHVHPRGLLREPLAGLKRADAFVLTRYDLIPDAQRLALEETLKAMNHLAPVYRCRHVLSGLRSPGSSAAAPPELPFDALRARPFFAFAGIANPAALHRQLQSLGDAYRGHYWFDDHHHYTDADVQRMQAAAGQAGAQVLVVTEKDWRKLRRLERAAELPILRLALDVQFAAPGEDGLVELIHARLEASAPSPAGQSPG
jgi:tetraacyldisaccharide 4'-kinase